MFQKVNQVDFTEYLNLIDMDDGERWNIVDNTYNEDTCLSFIKKTIRIICIERLFLLVFFLVKINKVTLL